MHQIKQTSVFATSLICLAALLSPSSADAAEPISVQAQAKLLRSVEIPAREPGLLEKLNVREGQTVEKGDVLAQLDTELYDLTERISRIELDVAEARAENEVNKKFAEKSQQVSSKVLERSKNARERYSKSISKSEIEKLNLEAERDELSIEQATNELMIAAMEQELADAELAANSLKLRFRTIIAPFDGMIVEPAAQDGSLYPQEGEWVNTGQPILRIVDLKTLRVDADVDAKRFDMSMVNTPVKFVVKNRDGDEQTFKGQIVFVSPEVNAVLEQVRIRVEIENPDLKLRPGQQGTLKIEL